LNLRQGTLLDRIAPLLAAARQCERMSCEVSRRQGELARSAPLAHALAAQSRQEAMHAAVFDAALALAPRAIAPPPRLAAAIGDYARHLHADLDAGDLAASLLGLQCVFESLAAVALDPPEGELTWLGKRLLPVLWLVRRQETAHRRLGEASLARLPANSASDSALQSAWLAYLDHAEAMTDAALAEFGGAAADFAHYRAHTRSCLEALGRGAPWRVDVADDGIAVAESSDA
jgi:hypothetical protein